MENNWTGAIIKRNYENKISEHPNLTFNIYYMWVSEGIC